MKARPLPSSFRDPSGFLFRRDRVLLRQINHSYREDYDKLVSSGLCERLVNKGLLVPHKGTDQPPADDGTAHKVIQPQEVPFISYPYEWSFSQLKDAGLAIGNNLPPENVAQFMSRLCRVLILEFVPKEDSQVQRLLASREDIFPTYHRSGFEEAFGRLFQIRRAERISDSKRTLYWLESRRQRTSAPGPPSALGSAATVESSPS